MSEQDLGRELRVSRDRDGKQSTRPWLRETIFRALSKCSAMTPGDQRSIYVQGYGKHGQEVK